MSGVRSIGWAALGCAVLVSLGACQIAPTQLGQSFAVSAARDRFAAAHREQAVHFERQGALADARREWQIVNALAPGRVDVVDTLSRLDAEIGRQYAEHLAAAKRARAKGRDQAARSELLRAVALRPDSDEAVDELRAVEAKIAYARLDAQPRVARGAVSEVDVYTAAQPAVRDAPSAKPTDTPRVAGAKAARAAAADSAASIDARIQQGMTALSNKDYAAALAIFTQLEKSDGGARPEIKRYVARAHRGIADTHYERGVSAFRSGEYEQAVAEFKTALAHAPDHHKARFYLSSAESLRKP